MSRWSIWTHDTLSFVAGDSWPTLGSGIKLIKEPFPYKVGRCFRFSLIDQSEGLPHIIRETQTSRFPPYRDLVRPQLTEQENKRIWDAVIAFVGGWVGGTVEEKTDQGYLVEFVVQSGDWQTVLVDPVTLSVKRMAK